LPTSSSVKCRIEIMSHLDVKTSVDVPTHHALRVTAMREGRTIAEIVRRAIVKELALAPVSIPAAIVERTEFANNRGARPVGCHLSPPLASAIRRLALEHDRSQGWIMRDLLRTELRRRGILPMPGDTVPAPAEAVTA
jgi:hypothetical protein